jgi:hypothetical protein
VIGYVLDEWDSFPGKCRNFVPYYHVQTDSGAHPASYPPNNESTSGQTLKTNRMPRPRAEVKNAWRHIPRRPQSHSNTHIKLRIETNPKETNMFISNTLTSPELCDISGSYGDKYEDESLLGYSAL